MSKTVAQIREETEGDLSFADLPVRSCVRVVTPCVDFYFFWGETGTIVKNTGRYLGIAVQFDKPRRFKDGHIQRAFNFNPCDLELLCTEAASEECVYCPACGWELGMP